MQVTRLLLSEVALPDYHPRAGAACPVFGYLIHHPDGLVLVDTGVGVGHPHVDEHFAPVHHQLAAGDVALVINSHLHFDHCGRNREFPGVPLVAQLAEYDAAQLPGHTIPEWVDFPGARWECVDGPAEILPGLSVLPSPGHTVGHQSVVVAAEGGPIVIAAQAVYDPDELSAGASAEQLPDDQAAATATSAAAIKALGPSRVLFSHDAREWVSGGAAS